MEHLPPIEQEPNFYRVYCILHGVLAPTQDTWIKASKIKKKHIQETACFPEYVGIDEIPPDFNKGNISTKTGA